MVNLNPLHDSYDKLKLPFNIKWQSQVHFINSCSYSSYYWILYFILCHTALWWLFDFPVSFDYIPILFWFWFYNIESSLKISLSLNPSSLGSTLGITSSGIIAKDGEMKVHPPWVFDIFMYMILEGEQDW